jgi:hypothetical protein
MDLQFILDFGRDMTHNNFYINYCNYPKSTCRPSQPLLYSWINLVCRYCIYDYKKELADLSEWSIIY